MHAWKLWGSLLMDASRRKTAMTATTMMGEDWK